MDQIYCICRGFTAFTVDFTGFTGWIKFTAFAVDLLHLPWILPDLLDGSNLLHLPEEAAHDTPNDLFFSGRLVSHGPIFLEFFLTQINGGKRRQVRPVNLAPSLVGVFVFLTDGLGMLPPVLVANHKLSSPA